MENKEFYSIFPELGHEVLKRNLENLWSFIHMLIAMLFV
jgi:hypothetical protein